MNSRKTEFLAGIFFLIGVAAVAYLAIVIGGGQFFSRDSYLLKARFQDVGGLNIGSRVLIAGVPVGTVADISLDPETYAAVVTMRLNRETRLDLDTIASVKSQGLIGDKYLALLPGGSEILLEEGEMIIDTESAVDIEGLISQFAFGSIRQEEESEPLDLGLGGLDEPQFGEAPVPAPVVEEREGPDPRGEGSPSTELPDTDPNAADEDN